MRIDEKLRSVGSVAARWLRILTRHIPSKNLVGSIYSTPNGVFSIAASDVYIANVLRRNRAWADDEVREICAVTDASSRVLFVGAHVGTLIVPVARHVDRVVAIEANPETYRFLAANLALNAVDNVSLHHLAAGEADGDIEFLLSRRNSGGAKRRPLVADARYVYDKPASVRVAMRRLDDLIDGVFQTIVMDIEGSEVFALRGMPRILAHAQQLFIEFLPHHLRNVAGADSDSLCDLILPHFPIATIRGQQFVGEAARAKLRTMFELDQGEDLMRFSRAS